MKNLYVLGAGDLAKELIDSILAGLLVSPDCEFQLKACVDIKPSTKLRGIPCLLQSDFTKSEIEDEKNIFIIATAHPTIKRKLISHFQSGCFPNFCHENSLVVGSELIAFSGNVFNAYSYVSSDVELGKYNLFNWHVSVGHDCKLGVGNSFNPGTRISGKISIGDYNFFGANSVVLEGRSIGHSNTLGACAMLRSDTGDTETWVGVPARMIQK